MFCGRIEESMPYSESLARAVSGYVKGFDFPSGTKVQQTPTSRK